MQTARPALPEFNPFRFQNKSTPVRRQRNIRGEFLFQFAPMRFERGAIGNRLALVGRPSRELAATRAAFEICLRFGDG